MNRIVVLGSAFVLALAAFLAGRYSSTSNHGQQATGKRVLYYVDPMDPAYHSDKPGIAPACGMPLVPVYEDEGAAANLHLPPGAVSITPDKQQLIGVKVETVEKSSGTRVIRTTGIVEADETRVNRVMAGTEGWVESVQDNPPGTLVKQNQLLATLYSKEFRNAEQAYISSVTSVERLKGGRDASPMPDKMGDANARLNEEQLRSLGMGEPQIKELARKRQVTRDVTVSSPIDGIVLTRTVAPGERFENGTEFYRIADLSKVWILADLLGDEARLLPPGARVKVTVRELSKTIYARVSESPALFDPASRTLKLRLQADNPGLVLRPDMFVDLEFSVKRPAGISVSQEAVLDSGLRKVVYVETSEGVFEPRAVETGAAYGDSIAITKGLNAGDQVVVSGNFLIDSESRLHPAMVALSSPQKPAPPQVETSNEEVRDPVCGMKLDQKQAHSSSHVEKYRGELFHFCSDNCQKKFQHDPGKYLDVQMGSDNSSRQSRRFND